MVFLGAAGVDIPADVRPWARPERERRERHAGQDERVAVVFDDAVAERARLGPWMPGG